MSILASKMQPVEDYSIHEYLTCTGAAYIDTKYKPTQLSGVEVKFQSTQTDHATIFGCDSSWVVDDFTALTHYAAFGTQNGPFTFYSSNAVTVKMDKNKVYQDGTLKQTFANNSFTSKYNLYIMALNRSGAAQEYLSGKVYYCKIWDNGTLVHDMLPAMRGKDKVVGLYDKITQSFYESTGSGLTCGPQTGSIGDSTKTELVTRRIAALVARGEKAVTPVLVEDDFTADTLDKDKWTCNGSYTITAAGCFQFPAFSTNTPIYGSCLLSKATYDGGDVDVTFTVKAIDTGRRSEANFGIFAGDWPPGGDGNYNSSPPDYAVMVEPSSYDNNTGMRLFLKGTYSKVLTSTVYTSNFTIRFVYMSAAKNLKIYINGALLYDETQDLSSYVGRHVAFAHASYYSGLVDIDGIRAVNPSVVADTVSINRSVGKVYRAVDGVVRQVFPDVLAVRKFIDGPRISDNLQFMLSGDGSGGGTPGAHSSSGNGILISHNECGGSMFITTEKVNVSKYSKLSARAIAYVNNTAKSMDFCVMLFKSMPADINCRTYYSYYNWYFKGFGDTKLVEAASEHIYPYNVGVPCSAMLDLSKINGEYYIALEIINNHNGSRNGSITIDSFMLE